MSALAFATITPVQAQVVLALAQGATVTAAAAAAGIHRSTINEWRRTQKEFDQAILEARDEYRLTLQDSLSELSRTALSTLRTLIEDPATPAAVRGRLALAILGQLKVRLFNQTLPEPSSGPANRDRAADASPVPAPPIRHNPPQSATSAALQNCHEPAHPQPPAEIRHNPPQSAASAASQQCPSLPPPAHSSKIGRNDLCPCGSGKKFKRCCLSGPTSQAA